ncbi:DUF3841 domain-containing protein [Ruminococcus sp.]|uniref:DUF3841 domain-containing protein n=1 Tax=Ruminococcus sp. TaxID=41978 RepID=UPI0025F7F7CE|nr:DUF3841 domain-containing protein [Ruminococcus sp.]
MFEAQKDYNWLANEMKKRIGKPSKDVEYPVWAWYIHDSSRKKPDLRKTGLVRRGKRMVCLEIDIPDNEVVLSDEEAWHFVINDWYLSGATDEAAFDKDISWFESLPDNKKQEVKLISWQRIFDIEPFANGFEIKGRYVQATFWELRAEQIRKVQFFTAR